MKRCSHLRLVEVVCRLAPGDTNTASAAKQWEETFGVPATQNQLAFTNGRARFIPGEEGKSEGIVSITIAIEGDKSFNSAINRAKKRGVYKNGEIDMLGLKWNFVLAGGEKSRL